MLTLPVALLALAAPPDLVGPPAPRRDVFGERLPDGAVARYGDHRMRGGTTEAVSFSADGKQLLRVRNGAVDVTDLATGRDVTPGYLAGLRGPRVYVLHDGRHLIHDANRTNQCWLVDPKTGGKTHDLDLNKQSAYSVVLTPDGKGALVWWNCGSGCGATVVDVTADRPACHHFQMAVWSAYALSPDRKRVYATSANAVDVYDVPTGKKVGSKATAAGPHGRPLVSADGRTLILSDGGRIHTAAVTADGLGEVTAVGTGSFDWGATVTTPDGSRLLVPGSGDTIDLKTGDKTAAKPAHKRPGPVSCYFSPDGRLACDLFANRGAVVWETTTGQTVREFKSLVELRQVVVTDDKTVTTLDADLVAREYDLATGRLLDERAKRETADGTRWGVLADDGGPLLEVETATGKAVLADPRTGVAVRALDHRATGGVSHAQGRPDLDRALLTGGGKTALVELSTGAFVRTLPDSYTAAALAPSGRVIAAAMTHTNQLVIVETVTNKVRQKFALGSKVYDNAALDRRGAQPQPAANQTGTIRFTPDGGTVALFLSDGRVGVWSVRDNLPVYQDVGYSGRRTGAISADGRWLAVAALDAGTLTLRDLHEPRLGAGTVPVGGVRSPCRSVAFTPDGKRLVTGHADGLALLWDVAELVALARAAPPVAADDRLWAALADADPVKAGQAVDDLCRDPAAAVRVLAARLEPVRKPAADTVRNLVEELTAPDYQVREAAQKRLTEIRDLAEDALTAVARQTGSAEQLERANQLLVKLRAAESDPTRVRLFRAVEVLERVGTPDARRVLGTLAAGAEESVITREARRAIRRIDTPPRR